MPNVCGPVGSRATRSVLDWGVDILGVSVKELFETQAGYKVSCTKQISAPPSLSLGLRQDSRASHERTAYQVLGGAGVPAEESH